MNYVVRSAVRQYLGRERLIDAAQELDAAGVTDVTGNDE